MLLSLIRNSNDEISEKERLAGLAQELEAPMKARGALLKQYLAHTIAPAARKVKEVHASLEQNFDDAFGYVVVPCCRYL